MLWRRNHPEVTIADARYRQVSMLYTIVLVMATYFGGIGLVNLLVFKDYAVAAFDFSGCACSVGTYFYIRHTANFRRASWMAVVIAMFILAGFTYLAKGAAYSLIWVTVLPPIAFFLLGLRAGSWVSGLFFAGVLLFLWVGLDNWQLGSLSLGSVFNFAEVMTAQWFIFRHYEKSRTEAYQQLKDSAAKDPLTGLWNRMRLDEALAETLELAPRTRQHTAVMVVDVDHFKAINDSFGHLRGDEVLVHLAKTLRRSIRQTDRVGRWGGEEFMVISPATDAAGAAVLAEKIRAAVAGAGLSAGQPVTVSLGVAVARGAVAPEALLRAADQQLYRAKEQGRDCVCMQREDLLPV